jgi:hypothetical protein
MGRTETFEWFPKLKNVLTSGEDAELSGCLSTTRRDEKVVSK